MVRLRVLSGAACNKFSNLPVSGKCAGWNYDVTADGQRFLIYTSVEAAGPPPITVVTNWAGAKQQ